VTIVDEAVVEGDWEYHRLQLPAGVSRRAAAIQLSIHAEFAGWELATVRLYSDGSRRIWLRRKRTAASTGLPGLIT
jgi:hypothetical protein